MNDIHELILKFSVFSLLLEELIEQQIEQQNLMSPNILV